MRHPATHVMARVAVILVAMVATFVWIGTGPALAQAVEQVGGPHRDWTAYKFQDGGSTACFIFTEPKSSLPNGVSRGPISVRVTHRPGAGTFDEVSFAAGYPFKENSNVRVTIGNSNFTLFTSGETAWTTSKEEDERLVRAMKAGATMKVFGESSRGTDTEDTFSLSGFTAAYGAMGKVCSR